LLALAVGSFVGPSWPLKASVFALGFANGTFAVAAIGSMMRLVAEGRKSREGVRMGLWGAAQAVAFGLGGLAGTVAVDVARWALGSPVAAYALVFVGEAVMFVVATVIAVALSRSDPATQRQAAQRTGSSRSEAPRYATQAGG
jgi:BCD family chlorophyll transporter-like MFS transporter